MHERAAPDGRPTLAHALAAAFDPGQTDQSFFTDLARLTAALTTATEVFVLDGADRTRLARVPDNAELGATLLAEFQSTTVTREPQQVHDALCIAIAAPSGKDAILVVHLRNAGSATRALAFERLVTLSSLSYATYSNAAMGQLSRILAMVSAEEPEWDRVASELREFVDADFLALATFKKGQIAELALSDQPAAAKRASLPREISQELQEAVSAASLPPGVTRAERADRALIMKTEGARRNVDLLPTLAESALSGAPLSGLSPKRRSRAIRWAAFALILCGLSAIPLPDARRVPGEVISLNARTVTAPLSGIILDVSVADGDAVLATQSELFRLDTSDIADELASAQADFSRALLERESARGARDATALRNAELEADSLRARIDLLEAKRERGVVLAPIDGKVVGADLGTLVGATVRQGAPILDVVDPDQIGIRLEVPDDLLLRIDDGEDGVFRPDFAPGQSFAGQVLSISPAQSTRSDIAVFDGRARLVGETGQLRPGLRGVFVFDREFRPLAQIVYHALRNWVLLKLWI